MTERMTRTGRVRYSACVTIASLSIGLLWASPTRATTIVRWYGDYLSGGDDIKGEGARSYRGDRQGSELVGVDVDGDGDSSNDSVIFYEYSLDVPLNPTPDGVHNRPGPVGRYLTDAPSAPFYGGLVSYNANYSPGRMPQATIEDSGRNSLVVDTRFASDRPWRAAARQPVPPEGFWSEMTLFVWDGVNATDGTTWDDDLVAFDALFVWKKEDFLGGGANAAVRLDETSRLAVDITRHWNDSFDARFVVQDGDQFYVSQATLEGLVSRFGYTNELIPTETLWAPYDPGPPFDIDFDQTGAVFEAHEFTDVASVGIYIEQDDFLHKPQAFVFDNFDVRATVIPSPSSLATALGGFVLILVCQSRRPARRARSGAATRSLRRT